MSARIIEVDQVPVDVGVAVTPLDALPLATLPRKITGVQKTRGDATTAVILEFSFTSAFHAQFVAGVGVVGDHVPNDALNQILVAIIDILGRAVRRFCCGSGSGHFCRGIDDGWGLGRSFRSRGGCGWRRGRGGEGCIGLHADELVGAVGVGQIVLDFQFCIFSW